MRTVSCCRCRPIAILALLWLAIGCRDTADQSYHVTGTTMGTTFSVTLASSTLAPQRLQRLQERIHEVVDDVDRKMSHYDPESELSRFNQHDTTEPFVVSTETFTVFQEALAISRVTGGAFDVTVAPLVDAWGFGPPGPVAAPPDPAVIAAHLSHVDYRKLELDPAASTVRKTDPAVRCDLSALAKGYAVDLVDQLLGAEALDGYLIEIGGEVLARGSNAGAAPWRVGIEQPGESLDRLYRVVQLQDAALATSGDYRNYADLEGQRVSHTIDPRTGHPITHALTSVSVIGERCMWADAIATALEVLGPDDGLRLAAEQGWAVLLIVRGEQGELKERATPDFDALAPRASRASGRLDATAAVEA